MVANPLFLCGAAYMALLYVAAEALFPKFSKNWASLLFLTPCVVLIIIIIRQGESTPHGVFEWIWSVGATLIFMGLAALVMGAVLLLLVFVIKKLLAPKWMKDDEAVALETVRKETRQDKWQKASVNAPSFRVRAAALEKLGLLQESKAELACHEQDISQCKAWIDEIEDQSLLIKIVKESEVPGIIEYALERVTDVDMLRNAKIEINWKAPATSFKIKCKEQNASQCCSILSDLLLAKEEETVRSCVQSTEGTPLMGQLFLNEYRERVSAWIAEQYAGEKILSSQPDGKLSEFCCPDGRFHLFEQKEHVSDFGFKDDDDMKAHDYRVSRYQICKYCRKIK